MSISLDIKLKRADKVYSEGETLGGVLVISSNSDFKHDGITLTLEGSVNLQISSKNVGILEAFYNSVKPIQLLNITCEVSGPGRLPSGVTQIPFQIPLKPKPNRVLYETYHGVYVNISYSLRCDMKRSFLSKDLQKCQQFLIQYKPGLDTCPQLPLKDNRKYVSFELSPANLSSGATGAPDFLLRGHLDTVCCCISKPFKGQLTLVRCAAPVRSIELQLVRVETCGCAEGYAREATEIQNIQIGDGDVPQNIPIPIYMVFPRLFTCPTLITTNFKIGTRMSLDTLDSSAGLATTSSASSSTTLSSSTDLSHLSHLRKSPPSPNKEDVQTKKKKKTESQPNLSSFVMRTSTAGKEKIDKQIAKAIFATNSSFRCIENSQVKKAIHLLRPGYTPPSRKTISTSLLDEIYEEEKVKCFSSLSGQCVNMSIDGWSNVHNEPVICATITTEDGRALLYETIDTSGKPHTSQYLTEIVSDLISSCKSQYDCEVKSFVTDNAANMALMRKTLEENTDSKVITYGCSAHILNLLCKDLQIPDVKEHVVQIVKYFRNNH